MKLLNFFIFYWRYTVTEISFSFSVLSWTSRKSILVTTSSLLIISLIPLWKWQQITLPSWEQQIVSQIKQSTAFYPNNLEITWDQKNLELKGTNRVIIPSYNLQNINNLNFPDNILIVTDSNNYPSDIVKDLGTSSLFITNSDKVWISNSQGLWTDLKLSEIPGFDSSFKIDATNYSQFVNIWVDEVTKIGKIISFLGVFFIPFFYTLIKLIQLTLNGLLIFLLFKLFPKAPSLKDSWQLSLQVGVIASLIDALISVIYTNIGTNYFSLNFWIILSVILTAKNIYQWEWPSALSK